MFKRLGRLLIASLFVKKKMRIILTPTIKELLNLADQFAATKRNFPFKRLARLLDAANAKNRCSCVLIEDDYQDEEYQKEYDSFYKDVFETKSSKHCTRLHFFSEILKSADETEISRVKDKYLGYCTLRPFPYPTISDAFIEKRTVVDSSRFVFIPCSFKNEVNLMGVKLNLDGFPYLQQDGRIVTCAQAAVRVVSQYFYAKKESTTVLTGPDVTEIAKKIPDQQGKRQVPSTGLNVMQIRSTLESLGFNPIVYNYDLVKKEEADLHPEQIIYRYLESGIPVIIGIRTGTIGHALVVIGHTFNPDYWWSQSETLYFNKPKSGFDYHCSTNWIQNFIVQDDNLGPYFFVSANFLNQNTFCIFAPVGKNVILPAEDAEKMAYQALTLENSEMREMILMYAKSLKTNSPASANLYWLEKLLQTIRNNEIILRTFSVTKNFFLSDYIQSNNAKVKEIYSKIDLPEKVWIVEISIPDLFCYSRKKIGEVVIDSTGDIRFTTGLLALHFPGCIIQRTPLNNKYLFHLITEEDNPIKHLYRA